MEKNKVYLFLRQNIYFFIIVAVWVVFSSPYLFFGKNPYPSDYQNNSFAPVSVYPGYAGPVKNNAQPDIIDQIYPWRYFDISELKNGRIPFWNPYSFAGTPHLANYQSAVFFPLNILFFLPFSFADVWGGLVVLQPLLAGFFTYLLARKLGVSKAGSSLSSLSFMFCGFITTWMGYATLGFAILPLPLALYLIESYREKEKQYLLIFLSVTIMFSYFSGHFQTSIYLTIGVLLYLLYLFLFSGKRTQIIECLLFVLFGILLSMPQILPSLELYSQSVRSNLFQKIEAIPLSYFPTLISPDFYGNPVTRNDWFGHYAEWSSFAGSIAFSIAVFTIFFQRTKKTLFFILLAIIGLLLSFDTPLLTFLVFLKIPVLSTSAASRGIVLFSFSIAILAGFGLDALQHLLTAKRKKVFVWIISIIILFACLLIYSSSPFLNSEQKAIAQKNSILSVLMVMGLVLSVLLSMRSKKKYIPHILFIIILLSAFEMYRFSSKWQSFSVKKKIYPAVGIENFYAKSNNYDRMLGLSGGEDAVYYKIPILSGYDPLFSKRYGEFVNYVANGKLSDPSRSVVNFPLDGKYTPQAINLLGVKYVVHKVSDGNFPWAFPFKKYPLEQFIKIYDDNSYQVYQNLKTFPKAFLVGHTAVAHKSADVLQYIFSHNMQNTAVVEEEIDGLSPDAKGTVVVKNYLPNKITLTVNASGPTFLVMMDNFYPGWTVMVNGVSEKIYRANYTFRGIVVPKGRSEVTFSYLPDSFLAGVYLFMVGIMGIVATIIFKKFQIKQ